MDLDVLSCEDSSAPRSRLNAPPLPISSSLYRSEHARPRTRYLRWCRGRIREEDFQQSHSLGSYRGLIAPLSMQEGDEEDIDIVDDGSGLDEGETEPPSLPLSSFFIRKYH